MFQQPSAVRPATGPTNFVAHPSICGFKQPSAIRPATGPTNLVAHPSIHAVLLKRCSLKNRPKSTPAHDSVAAAVSHKHHSIIRVGAGLLQFVHALYLHLGRENISIKNLFRPFSPASFISQHEICYPCTVEGLVDVSPLFLLLDTSLFENLLIHPCTML